MNLHKLWERVVEIYGDVLMIIVLVGAPLGAIHELLIVFYQR